MPYPDAARLENLGVAVADEGSERPRRRGDVTRAAT